MNQFKLLSVLCLQSFFLISQTTNLTTTRELAKKLNTVTTAVPFLMISPDACQGGMGDVGAATTPDANSIHWNPAKLAFIKEQGSAAISVSPWLKTLVTDIYFYYLNAHYKIDKKQAIGAALKYFSLGNIIFTDMQGTATGQFRPNEFSLDVAYSLKANEYLSFGATLGYVRSNLTGGVVTNGQSTQAGEAISAGFGAYYHSPKLKLGDKNGEVKAGLSINNIGNKVQYGVSKDFIPTNLRLGGGLDLFIDDYNTVSFYLDVNKLLVPTNPVYYKKINGEDSLNPVTNQLVIASGKDNRNVDVLSGIIQSFNDAPGGFEEEFKEYIFNFGMEYWYGKPKMLGVRAGYFYEAPTKGNRQYVTLGLGLKYSSFTFDMAYLIATSQRNPLENTMRFSLTYLLTDDKKN